MSEGPPRGFPQSEFEARTARAQRLMAAADLDGLLLMTEPEVRYFTGFLTQFWASPTRPWFLVVPREGRPIAVIPEIGAAGMADTWIEDIRTWSAPRPEDDGVTLLSEILSQTARHSGRIGVPMGHESHLRMPLADFRRLGVDCTDATAITRSLRMTKSELEIDKIRHVCQLTCDAFEALPQKAAIGQSERDLCRRLRNRSARAWRR